jgi:hypothetical protein
MNTEKIRELITSLKNKIMAMIGEFLKNGEKLDFMEKTIKKLDIPEKDEILKRITFLKERQNNLLDRATKFSDMEKELEQKLLQFKGVDWSVMGWRSIEIAKDLINKGLTLAKEGEKLIAEINTQNKDVYNLEQYLAKSTKEGFKFKLPKLEEITKPITSVLTPLAYVIGGIAVIYLISKFKRS